MKRSLVFFALSGWAAAADGISGVWRLQGAVQGIRVDRVCTIHREDNKLTGTCKGARDEMELVGEVDGNRITWKYNLDARVVLVFKGTLEPGSGMKGSIEIQTQGGNFTATPQ